MASCGYFLEAKSRAAQVMAVMLAEKLHILPAQVRKRDTKTLVKQTLRICFGIKTHIFCLLKYLRKIKLPVFV